MLPKTRRISYITILLLGVLVLASFFVQKDKTKGILTLYGNIDVREVDLGFQVMGQVVEMPFEEGDYVPKNAFMGRLDKQPYLDKVLEAEALVLSEKYAYNNAVEIYNRRDSLRSTGAISDEDYTNALSSKDIAYARLQQAEAALGVAKTNLKNTEIFAPTDGSILTRVQEPGTVVNIGQPIYTLSVESPVWVRAYVSEPELGLIYYGMKADILTDTPQGKIYKGQIGFISPVAEFTPKTVQTTSLRTQLVYRIRVIVDNADKFLKQGMPVTVQLPLSNQNSEKKEEREDSR